MNETASHAAPAVVLLAAVTFPLLASRVHELLLSRRNEARMRARGGVEAPGSRMPHFAALHASWFAAMALEVIRGGARPGPAWPLWLAFVVGASVLRSLSMRALGDRWSARVFVVHGEGRIRRGVYRVAPHPSYAAAAIELAAAPLLLGAWRTAGLFTVWNAALLLLRVRDENRALAAAARASTSSAGSSGV